MQYYHEMLPDYQTVPSTSAASGKGGDDFSSDNSPATTKATTNNASGSNHNQEHMDGDEFDEEVFMKMRAPKKPKDAVKAAETL